MKKKESGGSQAPEQRTATTMIWGVAAVLLGFLAFASVIGYNADDPNLWLSNHVPGHTVQNPCGWLGANIAYHMVSFYGLAAWVLPFVPIAWGIHILARRRIEHPWRGLAGGLLFVWALVTLFGVMSQDGWMYKSVETLCVPSGAGRAGGLVGAMSAGMMIAFAGTIGSYLLVVGIMFLSLVLLAERVVDWMLSALGRWALGLLQRIANRQAATPAVATAGAAGGASTSTSGRGRAEKAAPADSQEREKGKDKEAQKELSAIDPDVRATFGQPEAELRKAKAAAAAAENAPVIKIARVTEAAGQTNQASEAEREKREIAALMARAGTPGPAPKPDKVERKKPEAPAAAAAAIASTKAEPVSKVDKEERKPAAAAAAAANAGAQAPAAQNAQAGKQSAAAQSQAPAQAPAPAAARQPEPEPEPVIRQMSDPAPASAAQLRAARPAPAQKPAARPAPAAAASGPARKPLAEIDYHLPEIELLDKVENQAQITNEALAHRGQVLTDTLKEFKIQTRLVSIDRGPAVTVYELELAPGIRVQRVMELADNLAMAMKSPNVRIIAPIPGKDSIGIEVPNTEREVVRLRPLIESKEYLARAKDMAVPIAMGRDAAGGILVEDLARMPHLLVAGATGSGKSVCLNAFICTMLMSKSPAEVRLLLVDPKMVEMACYRGIPHLVAPVVTDMKRAVGVFEWALHKMDERYAMLSNIGCRDIGRFNRMPPDERVTKAEAAGDEEPERLREQMPYIVIIIDELADLMMLAGKEIEMAITRLAQKSRGVGIHIILATQRPSVDVVTGLIKANMPARVAFQVSSKVDSRTIIDQNGAEKLMGMGDMLYLPPTTAGLVRAKGTYVSDEEVNRIVEWSKRQAEPEFAPDLESALAGEPLPGEGNTADFRDDLYDEAVRVVLETQRGSVSLLQRRLGVGYTRAAKLIDMMAERGILGPYRGSKPRDILVTLEAWEAGEAGHNNPGAAPARGGMAGQRADERGPRPGPVEDDPEDAEPQDSFDSDQDAEKEEEGELATSESHRMVP